MVLLSALLAAPALGAIDEDDLLPVDEAFVLSAQPAAPGAIAVKWKIADGYYLYRHRISVKADAGFAAQPLQLPRGKAYEDEFFGKVETYRGTLTARLPGEAGAERTTLTISYQGCADAGICYPPQTRQVKVVLAAAAPSLSQPAFGSRVGAALGNAASSLLGNATRAGVARDRRSGTGTSIRSKYTTVRPKYPSSCVVPAGHCGAPRAKPTPASFSVVLSR